MDSELTVSPLARPLGFVAQPGRTTVLVILTLVYVVNYLDRQVLSILLPQIKAEFHLSDSALGLLSGTSFAVVYATLGVPLAFLADRMNRKRIIAASLTMFSVMTVLCGWVGQFWHLLLARVGTGIGEAGTAPAINSIIADLYPHGERATALAFYSAGLNVGLLLAFFGGGWIAQHYGWRDAFLAAGLPGLVLVFVVMFMVKEPRRGHADGYDDVHPAPQLFEVARRLWSQRSFRYIMLGASFSAFGGNAGVVFVPSFLARTHHLTPIQIGLLLSLLIGVFGFAGTLLAGVFSDRLSKRDVRWNMFVPAIAQAAAIPFIPVFYLSSNVPLAFAAAIFPALLSASYLGPAFAMTQGLVPLRMRATAVALLLFVMNMIGQGMGPQLVGILSDVLRPSLGDDSLRWALMSSAITGSLAAWCYWRASRTLKSDLARAA